MHATRHFDPLVFQALAVLLPLLAVAGCGSPEQNAQKHYESGMALIEKKG